MEDGENGAKRLWNEGICQKSIEKVEKLEENVEFELNGSFRGAGELKLGQDGSKNDFKLESELRL